MWCWLLMRRVCVRACVCSYHVPCANFPDKLLCCCLLLWPRSNTWRQTDVSFHTHIHTLQTELRYKDMRMHLNQSQSETHRQPLPLKFMTSTEMDVSTVLCESAPVHRWLELEKLENRIPKSVQVNVASHRSGA